MPESVKSSELEQYIIDHLDEAIEKHYIKPYFQPVIRTVSRQLCGMEALARWDDPKWGLLPPGSFSNSTGRFICSTPVLSVRCACSTGRRYRGGAC